MNRGLSSAFLASLHPSGDPASIVTADELAEPGASAREGDVVVLAMSPAQCRAARERDAIIGRALASLAPQGVLWVAVPPRWRRTVIQALGAHGVMNGTAFVHRRQGAVRTSFALTGRGLRFALSSGLISERWRAILTLLERVPGGKALLLRCLPVGFPAYRPGTRPFAWLASLMPDPNDVDIALTTGWRGEQAPFLVFAFGGSGALVVKRAGREHETSIAYEAEMLATLVPTAAKAGLAVPQLVDFSTTSRLCSLIETAVPGQAIARLIGAGYYRDLGAIAESLAAWLGRWSADSVRHVELTPAMTEALFLSPAREIAGAISGGKAYLDWLSCRTGELIGRKVPLVAAHNDLTMANVLGDRSGACSVVDWEAASRDGLPLADFRYAMCDAAMRISGGNRVAAFRACFLDDGGPRRQLAQCEARLRVVVGGPDGWLGLCAHGAWLQHAANEQARSGRRGENDSFRAIAALLATAVPDR